MESDYWSVQDVGTICSDRFRTLCLDIGASNLCFEPLTEKDYEMLYACTEWGKIGAIYNPD